MPEELPTHDLDEFCTYWWGSEPEEYSIADAVEDGSMLSFAKAVLTWFGS